MSAAPVPPSAYAYDVQRDGDGSVPLGRARRPRSRRTRRWPRILVWSLVIGSLLVTGLLVWFFFIRPIGFGTSLVALTAALVPVMMVFLAVWWLDRFTPQPRITLVYSFAWGAAGSVMLTMVIGGVFSWLITPEDAAETATQFLSVVIQAPVVEEATKSAGLLVLLLWRRRFIASPIDGVVYAALIAGGFAFTENILYFGRAFQEAQAAGDAAAFWQTFIARGLLSPFAHVSFTSLCGLGLGIAAEQRSIMLNFGLGLGGLSLGMCLHALWNGASFFLDVDPQNPYAALLRFYLMVQVPIFLILTATAVGLRLRESRVIRRQLSDYGRAGWFSPSEVEMLRSMRRRNRALRWASRHGAVPREAMRQMITAAVALAVERQSALHARPSEAWRRRESELLTEITAHRRVIDALAAPVAVRPVSPVRESPVREEKAAVRVD